MKLISDDLAVFFPSGFYILVAESRKKYFQNIILVGTDFNSRHIDFIHNSRSENRGFFPHNFPSMSVFFSDFFWIVDNNIIFANSRDFFLTFYQIINVCMSSFPLKFLKIRLFLFIAFTFAFLFRVKNILTHPWNFLCNVLCLWYEARSFSCGRFSWLNHRTTHFFIEFGCMVLSEVVKFVLEDVSISDVHNKINASSQKYNQPK